MVEVSFLKLSSDECHIVDFADDDNGSMPSSIQPVYEPKLNQISVTTMS